MRGLHTIRMCGVTAHVLKLRSLPTTDLQSWEKGEDFEHVA